MSYKYGGEAKRQKKDISAKKNTNPAKDGNPPSRKDENSSQRTGASNALKMWGGHCLSKHRLIQGKFMVGRCPWVPGLQGLACHSEKWGGQSICCPPLYKKWGGTCPPCPPPFDAPAKGNPTIRSTVLPPPLPTETTFQRVGEKLILF